MRRRVAGSGTSAAQAQGVLIVANAPEPSVIEAEATDDAEGGCEGGLAFTRRQRTPNLVTTGWGITQPSPRRLVR